MNAVTIDQLVDLMRTCAGEDEETQLNGDVANRTFAELGYDSLALLETTALVKREYGVAIPDDTIGELVTPGALLDHINATLTAAA
jgi:minimal PKS acyl carrier protein